MIYLFSSVSAWFAFIITYLPDFLMSHPVIDMLALSVAVLVISFVGRLLHARV